MQRIAVLEGDGIGAEVVTAAVRVLQVAAEINRTELEFDRLLVGLAALETHGSTLPAATLTRLAAYSGWMLGPVNTADYPRGDERYPNPSARLRTAFQLYANVRPAKTLIPRLSRPRIDLVIVRENTEGFYADRNVMDGNGELRISPDAVVSVRVVTRLACMRLARRAFELARQRRHRVTLVHKANVLPHGDGLFLECCRAVAADCPEVQTDDRHVDAAAAELVTSPEHFDVIATTNMFGDILSGTTAGLVGGLGVAPSLNVGDEHAMAQAVHGSAPTLAGRGTANPVAMILSTAMLLRWLSKQTNDPVLDTAGGDIERAVDKVLEQEQYRTPDLGGDATSALMTQAICNSLRDLGADRRRSWRA